MNFILILKLFNGRINSREYKLQQVDSSTSCWSNSSSSSLGQNRLQWFNACIRCWICSYLVISFVTIYHKFIFLPPIGDSIQNDACLLNQGSHNMTIIMCLTQLKAKKNYQLLILKLATVMGEPCIFIMDYWIINDIYLLD